MPCTAQLRFGIKTQPSNSGRDSKVTLETVPESAQGSDDDAVAPELKHVPCAASTHQNSVCLYDYYNRLTEQKLQEFFRWQVLGTPSPAIASRLTAELAPLVNCSLALLQKGFSVN